ncbi:MAG: helix-turn-helix domain-containing protein [Granulosicoccus sp.]
MTTTSQNKGSSPQTRGSSKRHRADRPDKLKASPTLRQNSGSLRSASLTSSMDKPEGSAQSSPPVSSRSDASNQQARHTAIEQCVQSELRRYFDMLDGEEPANLYRMVIRQAECALVNMVMEECRGNQTRASEWLGISRGNLRTKLASMEK